MKPNAKVILVDGVVNSDGERGELARPDRVIREVQVQKSADYVVVNLPSERPLCTCGLVGRGYNEIDVGDIPTDIHYFEVKAAPGYILGYICGVYGNGALERTGIFVGKQLGKGLADIMKICVDSYGMC